MVASDKSFELIGYAEAGEILHVLPKTVANYHSRAKVAGYPQTGNPFPRPATYILGHPRWPRGEIEKFQAGRKGPGWHEKGGDRVSAYTKADAN